MTLPKSCEVEALRVWVNDVWLTAPHDDVWGTMAHAVRALLERVALDAANRGKYATPAEAVRQAMGGVA